MNITLKFLGAARNVTGSRYLLEADGTRLLVDCGLYQEREFQARNWDPFPVPAGSVSALLVTHAHLDHCGLVPRLCRQGFRGPIYCTGATAEIARFILEDSARLQEEDARLKQERHEGEGRRGPYPEQPLYTTQDAITCQDQFSPVRYGQAVALGHGIEATFHNAGHVLGASNIRVVVRQGAEERAIVFSGDVGRWNVPFLEDPAVLEAADYVLVESTYGDKVHPSEAEAVDHLAAAVKAAYEAGGNIVIPTFALERSQDILYHLNTLVRASRIPHLLTFLDSPMAISVNEVFQRHPELYDEEMTALVRRHRSPFDLPGLHVTRTSDESKAINHLRGTAIIMAGSGMCTGGRIKHHLEHNIARPESTILFVGYQAAGTLGREIADGAREVRIHGRTYPVRAKVVQLSGFSAHADRDELLRWLSGARTPPRRAFVVHGEPETAASFAEFVRAKLGWEVSVPAYQDEVVLD
jgi:metallo-beta-lactamase family protein